VLVLSLSGNQRYIAFCRDLAEPPATKFVLPDGFKMASRRPTLLHPVPSASCSRWKFGVLGALSTVLRGGSYFRVYVVSAPDGSVAHYSVLHPKYFRFPFMGVDDVQIGGLWTEPRYRGLGLAGFAVQAVLRAEAGREAVCWYVVADDNLPSLRVARKNDFAVHGFIARRRRFGIDLLARFGEMDRAG
jgi:GNAT superfamily N-acetyltransferase